MLKLHYGFHGINQIKLLFIWCRHKYPKFAKNNFEQVLPYLSYHRLAGVAMPWLTLKRDLPKVSFTHKNLFNNVPYYFEGKKRHSGLMYNGSTNLWY